MGESKNKISCLQMWVSLGNVKFRGKVGIFKETSEVACSKRLWVCNERLSLWFLMVTTVLDVWHLSEHLVIENVEKQPVHTH